MRLKGIIFIGLSVVLGLGLSRTSETQTGCTTPPSNASGTNNGQPVALPPDSTVQVYFNASEFTQDQITAMEGAFTNWQNADPTSGIMYQFTTVTGPPPATGNFIYVVHETPTPNGVPDNSLGGYSSISYTDGATFDTISNGTIQMNPSETVPGALEEVMAHEIGHWLGLGDCNGCSNQSTVMADPVDTMNGTSGLTSPTSCDVNKEKTIYSPPPPPPSTPTPTPTPSQPPPCSPIKIKLDQDGGCNPSPIIVDVDGSGFSLTDAENGVVFDIFANGTPVQVAWTAIGSTNAFLVLDRNGNDLVDSGAELFGNFTPQPNSQTPNGFLALAEFDKQENGGNGDGIIDSRDAVFSRLQLWQDTNHNGISEPWELHTLDELGVQQISLDYQAVRRVDQYGNQFRFRSNVDDSTRSRGARWAWDVFFVWQNR